MDQVVAEAHHLGAQMVVSAKHDFVTTQIFRVVGSILEELEVFAVVVADKVHRGIVIDEPSGVDAGGFLILGEQRQTFVGFSPHQKIDGIVPATARV